MKGIRDVAAQQITKEITSWVTLLAEEHAHNYKAILGLIRFQLIQVSVYDAHLAKMLVNGSQKTLELAIYLVKNCCLEGRYAAAMAVEFRCTHTHSLCLSVSLSVSLSASLCLSVSLSLCLSVSLSVSLCLSLCLLLLIHSRSRTIAVLRTVQGIEVKRLAPKTANDTVLIALCLFVPPEWLLV